MIAIIIFFKVVKYILMFLSIYLNQGLIKSSVKVFKRKYIGNAEIQVLEKVFKDFQIQIKILLTTTVLPSETAAPFYVAIHPRCCTAHLAYHAHKSGRKTPIIIIILPVLWADNLIVGKASTLYWFDSWIEPVHRTVVRMLTLIFRNRIRYRPLYKIPH